MGDHIGSKVNIPGTNGYGILRYYGPIRDKKGVFGGVELLGAIAATRGKNSGDVDGVKYFDVKHPMTGLFLPFERLKQGNQHLTIAKSSSSLSPYGSDRSSRRTSSGRGFRQSAQDSDSQERLTSVFKSMSLGSGHSKSGSFVLEDEVMNDSKGYANSDKRNDLWSEEFDNLKEENRLLKADNAEKTQILKDLTSTVGDIQLVLEEYENNITEKDKKIVRQKKEFEKSREEWRDSLEILASNQQDTENFYETEILQLKEKIKTLEEDQAMTESTKQSISGQLVDSEKFGKMKQQNADLLTEVSLLKEEIVAKEVEIQKLKDSNDKLQIDMEILRRENEDIKARIELQQGIYNHKNNSSKLLNKEDHKVESEVQQSVEFTSKIKSFPDINPRSFGDNDLNQSKTVELPIYKPPDPSDPSEGRSDWCGLCERDGHSSLNCPYENDIF